jgi:V-ATPase subunit C
LTVGTLDTLMTLSDDLVKTDTIVEQTVRKIEKTTAELFDRKSSDLTVGGKYKYHFTRYELMFVRIGLTFGVYCICCIASMNRCTSYAIYPTVCLGLGQIPKSKTSEGTCCYDCRWSRWD